MRNKIIDSVIESVVDGSNQSAEFKAMFKAYIRNKFSGTEDKDDLKTILNLITASPDEEADSL